jgi:hypothetical protein
MRIHLETVDGRPSLIISELEFIGHVSTETLLSLRQQIDHALSRCGSEPHQYQFEIVLPDLKPSEQIQT